MGGGGGTGRGGAERGRKGVWRIEVKKPKEKIPLEALEEDGKIIQK
jgi:hypothetical protein